MSPNTPVEDALLDLYLMLSKAGSPLHLFDEVVGFMEKHAGHTFQKGVTLPRRETLIKRMQQQHNVPPPVPIPVILENGTDILRKQRRPSALQTMNCTPADNRLQKSVGLTTDRNRARLPSLFGMKFTQVPSQYSKQIKEVQLTIKVWVRVKAPSRHVSCKSSAALRLFKQ